VRPATAAVVLALCAGLLLADPRAVATGRLARIRQLPAGSTVAARTTAGAGTGTRATAGAGPVRVVAAAAALALLTGHVAVATVLAVLAILRGVPAARASRAERLARSELAADLPRAAELVATCLEAGAAPAAALSAVADAVGGPLAARLGPLVAALGSGADLGGWPADPADPVARLARAVARASGTGAPLAASVRSLAVDERERARWDALERARRAGIQAVGPLAACFLPAFVLLGVVPVVVGVARTVLAGWG
jgi:pilus assembly protein TadC